MYHKHLSKLLEKLEGNSEIPIHCLELSSNQWMAISEYLSSFSNNFLIFNNYMNLNTGKSHLLIFGLKYEHQWAQIGKDMIVWQENIVKLLRKRIDNYLIFDSHILDISSKTIKKLSVYVNLIFQKARILFKSFFEPQFKYCPIIWMFCSRSANNKINKFHGRA